MRKSDLDEREAQWYGASPTKGSPGGGGSGGKMPRKGASPTHRMDAATSEDDDQMAEIRSRMQAQRDETEKMIEQLLLAHDQARKEKEALTMELASMSADSGRKLLMKIVIRLSRMQLSSAWQAWHGNSTMATKAALREETEELKVELVDLRGRITAAKDDIEERLRVTSEWAMKNASSEQRFLLLKIFGKLVGDSKRSAFIAWFEAYADFKRQYTLVSRILVRLAQQNLHKGWTKWYRDTFVESKLSLDEQIKILESEVVKSQKIHDDAERNLDKVIKEITEAMIRNASPHQRALMEKILGKYCSLLTRWGFQKWVKQLHLFKHAYGLMSMILRKLLNSELNFGFCKWRIVCIKDAASASEMVCTRYKQQASLLRAHYEQTQQRIEELQRNVQKMRDSVLLRHSAMTQIARGVFEVDDEIRDLLGQCKKKPREFLQAANDTLDDAANMDNNSRVSRGPVAEAANAVDANTRAHLLVFLQNLEHAAPTDTIGALAAHPGFSKHRDWLKEYVLLGDQRVAAAIRAYEFTLDPHDFVESLDMIYKVVSK